MEIKTINQLQRRILDLSYKHHLAHLGSCLTALPIIEEIYNKPGLNYFILSSGHAGLALYCVIEKHTGRDAESLLLQHGIHPNRDLANFIYASAGSLGHGLGISIGVALTHPEAYVYCLVTDGELTEGSCWEALRVAQDLNLKNLIVYCNFNGWAAYKRTDYTAIKKQLRGFKFPVKIIKTNVDKYPFLKNQDSHYHVMTEEEYKSVS